MHVEKSSMTRRSTKSSKVWRIALSAEEQSGFGALLSFAADVLGHCRTNEKRMHAKSPTPTSTHRKIPKIQKVIFSDLVLNVLGDSGFA